MQIAIPAILAAFIILFLHWFPWHLLRGEKLGRLTAYTLGTVVIVGVTCATYAVLGYVQAAWILIAVAMAAGVATLAAYFVDGILERHHELQDLRDKAAYKDGPVTD